MLAPAWIMAALLLFPAVRRSAFLDFAVGVIVIDVLDYGVFYLQKLAFYITYGPQL